MSKLLVRHLTYLRAAGQSPNTIHDRERLLRAADIQLPHGIDQADHLELASFLAHDEWEQWTRCTYFMHLTGFYRWACAEPDPYLDYNPMLRLKRPKRPVKTPDPVTDDELRTALTRSDRRWRMIITLAAYAGLRRADITNLTREDVTKDTIRILGGKGRKDAILPTHTEVWRVIEPLPPGRIAKCEPRALSISARRHFDRIGLPDVHLHRFRDWHATMLVRSGTDIRVVQELMRHASLDMTARYVLIADEQRRLAIRSLPALDDSSTQQEAA